MLNFITVLLLQFQSGGHSVFISNRSSLSGILADGQLEQKSEICEDLDVQTVPHKLLESLTFFHNSIAAISYAEIR